MTGGYSDFDRKLAKENMREMKVHVSDVDLWVSFMQWGHSEARKNGSIGYMAARNECKRFLLQCIRDVVSAQQSGQTDGAVCTCKKPIATTSTQNLCGNCGNPRR